MNKAYRAASQPQGSHRPARPFSINQPLKAPPTAVQTISEFTSSEFQIGSYVVNRSALLGKGFCSKVYKAYHTQTNQAVALKLVDLQKIKSVVHRRFLKNEVKCLKDLRNKKHIINLIEIIQNKTQLALVCQLCKESLSQMMRDKYGVKRPLQIGIALKIFQEVVFGYMVMRAEGYVHRDIKPANILMGLDGEVRLCDLGFATKETRINQDRFVNVGSPLYMAPEIIKENDYSIKGDIWALGLVFLEMLIGKLPWEDVKESELRSFIMNTNFGEVIPRDIDIKWKMMLLGCLQTNPKKRMGALGLIQYLKPDFQPNIYLFERPGSKSEVYKNNQKQYNEGEQKGKITITTIYTEHQQQNIPKKPYHSNQNSRLKITTLHQGFTGRLIAEKLKEAYQKSKKSFSSRKLSSKPHQIKSNLLNLKLSQPQSDTFTLLHKEQTSYFHLSRFIFKILEQIDKTRFNVHCLYFEVKQDLSLLKEMALLILSIFHGIKHVRSCYKIQDVKGYQRSQEYLNLMELIKKYEKNYKQYFLIKFDLKSHSSIDIDVQRIVEKIKQYTNSAHSHQILIFQQILHSQLQEVNDPEICKFMILLDNFCILVQNLSLKIKNPNIFVKTNRIQELTKKQKAVLTLQDIKKMTSRAQT